MSYVAVEKVHEEGRSTSLFDEVTNLAARVRQRAFEIFERRGGEAGSDVDDWLNAERELIWTPQSELIETDGKFELQVAVPGFEAKDVHVTALPDAVVVRAEAAHKHERTEGDIRFCEFGERSLFRRFDLPASIDVDKVNASLDQGLLKLTASKRQSGKKIAVAA